MLTAHQRVTVLKTKELGGDVLNEVTISIEVVAPVILQEFLPSHKEELGLFQGDQWPAFVLYLRDSYIIAVLYIGIRPDEVVLFNTPK